MTAKEFFITQLTHCLLAVLCIVLVACGVLSLILFCIYFIVAAPLVVAMELFLILSNKAKDNGRHKETKE